MRGYEVQGIETREDVRKGRLVLAAIDVKRCSWQSVNQNRTLSAYGILRTT